MARSPTAEAQKENPDSVAAEIGVEGIEALPKRVERYGKARKSALDVAEYMQGLPGQQAKDVSQRVMACGDYLLFRHFSLDHWDMRTGRNRARISPCWPCSLDHWDMRTGRNLNRRRRWWPKV